MIPAVPVPRSARLRTPVEIKLNPGWSFDPDRRVFLSEHGEVFNPRGELPKKSRIVHKTPALLAAASATRGSLSEAEEDLLRYLQIILPYDIAPRDHLAAVKEWPPVEEASLPPEVSLPKMGPG